MSRTPTPSNKTATLNRRPPVLLDQSNFDAFKHGLEVGDILLKQGDSKSGNLAEFGQRLIGNGATASQVSHVALYVGKGQIVDSTPKHGVALRDLQVFTGARLNILRVGGPVPPLTEQMRDTLGTIARDLAAKGIRYYPSLADMAKLMKNFAESLAKRVPAPASGKRDHNDIELCKKLHICSMLVMRVYDTAFDREDERHPLDTRHADPSSALLTPAYFYDHGALVDVTP